MRRSIENEQSCEVGVGSAVNPGVVLRVVEAASHSPIADDRIARTHPSTFRPFRPADGSLAVGG